MKMSASMPKRILGVLVILVAATASLVRPAGAAETAQQMRVGDRADILAARQPQGVEAVVLGQGGHGTQR